MSAWLTVIGIGDDGLDGLAPRIRRLVEGAEVVVGGARHLAMLPEGERELIAWPKPFDTLIERLREHRGRAICVLASGDPCWHGVGSLLSEQIGARAVRIIPAPSAFNQACARLGWRLAEVETLSVHGRPIESIVPYVQPEARLLVLSEDARTSGALARLLGERGYGESTVTAFSHLGAEDESVVSARASAWGAGTPVADLNTVAIECRASPGALLLPRCPGLPDDAFRHDGQITKQEVRAATLAALAPVGGQLLWDVGAGCGSVAIEWMRADHRCRAIAIESDAGRCDVIADNAKALGVPALAVVCGRAPGALAELERPHAVFIGGALTEPRLLTTCWGALPRGGRLVANSVSIEGGRALGEWHAKRGGRLVRIGVERSEPLGRFRGFRPMMTVTQYSVTKPGGRR